jgi:hypothetical protein
LVCFAFALACVVLLWFALVFLLFRRDVGMSRDIFRSWEISGRFWYWGLRGIGYRGNSLPKNGKKR